MKSSGGFTLVEMIVAIALFAIVMVVAVGALLSLVGANKKAQAMQSVMNNLNISLDSMVRNIRMGREYRCINDFNYTAPFSTGGSSNECNGTYGTAISFDCNSETQACARSASGRWVYAYDATGALCHGPNGETHLICRSTNGGSPGSWTAITDPQVQIQDMRFYVLGTVPGDALQPKVVIVISGQAGANGGRTQSNFHIQATAIQRELDL